MDRIMLSAKLHQVRVTHAEFEYEGSCAIDGAWLDRAGMREYEQIQIYNIENGERFTTYIIRAEDGSKMISVNGAAAHKASPGDRIIICTYANFSEEELKRFKPSLLYFDQDNNLVRSSHAIPVQVA